MNNADRGAQIRNDLTHREYSMSDANPTVFVVDDDPPVLKAIGRVLRSTGLNVVTFESSREFLNDYDAGVTGCLLLDLSMPDLDGLELQRRSPTAGARRPSSSFRATATCRRV